MVQTYDLIAFDPDDLTVMVAGSKNPFGDSSIYGLVDGIQLRLTECSIPSIPAMLMGWSEGRTREVRVSKSTSSMPFHGVIQTHEHVIVHGEERPTRRTIQIVNVSATTLPELFYKMNREISLIRQALAASVR